jgi:hypothetical protein
MKEQIDCDYPGISLPERSHLLGQMWREMAPYDKERFLDAAESLVRDSLRPRNRPTKERLKVPPKERVKVAQTELLPEPAPIVLQELPQFGIIRRGDVGAGVSIASAEALARWTRRDQ